MYLRVSAQHVVDGTGPAPSTRAVSAPKKPSTLRSCTRAGAPPCSGNRDRRCPWRAPPRRRRRRRRDALGRAQQQPLGGVEDRVVALLLVLGVDGAWRITIGSAPPTLTDQESFIGTVNDRRSVVKHRCVGTGVAGEIRFVRRAFASRIRRRARTPGLGRSGRAASRGAHKRGGNSDAKVPVPGKLHGRRREGDPQGRRHGPPCSGPEGGCGARRAASRRSTSPSADTDAYTIVELPDNATAAADGASRLRNPGKASAQATVAADTRGSRRGGEEATSPIGGARRLARSGRQPVGARQPRARARRFPRKRERRARQLAGGIRVVGDHAEVVARRERPAARGAGRPVGGPGVPQDPRLPEEFGRLVGADGDQQRRARARRDARRRQARRLGGVEPEVGVERELHHRREVVDAGQRDRARDRIAREAGRRPIGREHHRGQVSPRRMPADDDRGPGSAPCARPRATTQATARAALVDDRRDRHVRAQVVVDHGDGDPPRDEGPATNEKSLLSSARQ